MPTGADLLAILERVIRRVAPARLRGQHIGRRLRRRPATDLFAKIQAEAAISWRSPPTATSGIVTHAPAAARVARCEPRLEAKRLVVGAVAIHDAQSLLFTLGLPADPAIFAPSRDPTRAEFA